MDWTNSVPLVCFCKEFPPAEGPARRPPDSMCVSAKGRNPCQFVIVNRTIRHSVDFGCPAGEPSLILLLHFVQAISCVPESTVRALSRGPNQDSALEGDIHIVGPARLQAT